MIELKALFVALFLFEAVHWAGVLPGDRLDVRQFVWVFALAGVGYAAHVVFLPTTVVLGGLVPLTLFQLVRARIGAIGPQSGYLSRWRYVPVLLVGVFTEGSPWTLATFLLLAVNRKNIRYLLRFLTILPEPFNLSPLAVDQIMPERIRYDRSPKDRQSGMAMMELVTGLTVLVVVTSAMFLAVAQRSVRLRQLRETAVAREAAVSALEVLSTVPFPDLLSHDGEEFAVVGGVSADPGRVRVVLKSDGLAEVTVTAPRRGAAPIVLTTLRSGRAP